MTFLQTAPASDTTAIAKHKEAENGETHMTELWKQYLGNASRQASCIRWVGAGVTNGTGSKTEYLPVY